MFKYNHICLIAICTLSLSGCGSSLLTSRETNPSIQDITMAPHFWPWAKNAVNTFSTTASRRMVLVNSQNWGDEITSCAEPPPDVGETFASAISDAIKLAATEPKTGINGSLSNDYAKAVATQITPLVYRTQALQVYRDAIHSHCIDKMNGWYKDSASIPVTKTLNDVDESGKVVTHGSITFDANNYNAVKLYYFEKTIEALKYEIPKIIQAQTAFFNNQKNTGVSMQDVKEIANAVKSASPTTVTSTATGTTIVSSPNAEKK
jgi:hypothetical protein